MVYILIKKKLELKPSIDEIYFVFNNIEVKSTNNTLEITFITIIEDFYSLDEADRLIRADFLIILGILSFISQDHYDVADISEGYKMRINQTAIFPDNVTILKINNIDYSNHLVDLLKNINSAPQEEQNLFYSVLDRWRKAQYYLIKDHSEGLNLDPIRDVDEALLSFFHILELLVTLYENEQTDIATQYIGEFLLEFYDKTHLCKNRQIPNKVSEKKKLLKELLFDNHSISSKIFFMLKKQGLLEDRTEHFISEIVNARNSVAHGRSVYTKNLIWPLPAFFSIHDHDRGFVYDLYVLTARVLSIHWKSKFWEQEWQECLNMLIPSPYVIKEFIKNKEYIHISFSNFLDGTNNHIIPAHLLSMALYKKISIQDFELVMEPFIIDIIACDYNNFNPMIGDPMLYFILLADSQNQKISQHCQNQILRAKRDSSLVLTSNIKDYISIFQSKNLNPIWFHNLFLQKNN